MRQSTNETGSHPDRLRRRLSPSSTGSSCSGSGSDAMKLHVLAEPQLEFRAGNLHVDPRYGLATCGPADADTETAPRRIVVGIVGSAANVAGIRGWLERCRQPLAAKESKPGQEN